MALATVRLWSEQNHSSVDFINFCAHQDEGY